MRDDRDGFDPDFSPSWSAMRAKPAQTIPWRIRLTLAGMGTFGVLALVITALLVRG